MYHFCSENRLSKILFSNPFPKKTLRRLWISKIRIWIWSEESTPSVDFMDSWSVFEFAQKTQNTFLDSEIHIWIFPKKRTLRVDIQIKSFYLSVHVVVELSSNIMRGNWGFRWWPKNALLWQITSNQNLVGMDQAVDTLRNTVSIPEGHVWSLACAWFKGSNCPQMRPFTLYKNISPLTIIHVWTDAIRELKQGCFERRASSGSETYFL